MPKRAVEMMGRLVAGGVLVLGRRGVVLAKTLYTGGKSLAKVTAAVWKLVAATATTDPRSGTLPAP